MDHYYTVMINTLSSLLQSLSMIVIVAREFFSSTAESAEINDTSKVSLYSNALSSIIEMLKQSVTEPGGKVSTVLTTP